MYVVSDGKATLLKKLSFSRHNVVDVNIRVRNPKSLPCKGCVIMLYLPSHTFDFLESSHPLTTKETRC